MRWIGLIGLIAVLASISMGRGEEKRADFAFSKEDVGKLPRGWQRARTGKGEGSVWKVVADPTAPSKAGAVLAQTAVGPRPLYNLCVAEDTAFQDVEVQVALKAVKGKDDQGGGVVWRYQDANNYYVARINPLEGNYRVYKVIAGKRIQLETETAETDTNKWYTVKVRHVGDQIECYLDGKKLLSARDATLARPGKVGLWTKADAQTHFDSFTAKKGK